MLGNAGALGDAENQYAYEKGNIRFTSWYLLWAKGIKSRLIPRRRCLIQNCIQAEIHTEISPREEQKIAEAKELNGNSLQTTISVRVGESEQFPPAQLRTRSK